MKVSKHHFVDDSYCSVNNYLISNIISRRRSVQKNEMNVINASQQDTLLKQITFMCVSVSFAFIIFIAPSVILLIGKAQWQYNQTYKITKAVNNLLVYCNHSINCYLYLCTGKRFRQETIRMLKCQRKGGVCCCGDNKNNINAKWDSTASSKTSESRSTRFSIDSSNINNRLSMDSSKRFSLDSHTRSSIESASVPRSISDGKVKLTSYASIPEDPNPS